MVLPVNSTKGLSLKKSILYNLLQKIKAGGTLYNSSYADSITLIPKPNKALQERPQTNNSHEHRYKNPQQNISKLNPTMYKKNYRPQSSGIYSRYASPVQHSKMN